MKCPKCEIIAGNEKCPKCGATMKKFSIVEKFSKPVEEVETISPFVEQAEFKAGEFNQ